MERSHRIPDQDIDMRKAVIIGANEFQNPLILKAKEMGFETHVFAWQAGDIGEKTADHFHPVSIIEKEKILEECRLIDPDAVMSIGSDLAAITVQYVAKNLGLNCNSDRCIEISTNKNRMREAFRANGIPVPKFRSVGENDDLSFVETFSFPIIVKPTDRSGSRSITELSSTAGLADAVRRAINDSFEKRAIVEEYLFGNEYSCECISFHGEHHLLQVTQKFTTGEPNFIETGHIEPSDIGDTDVVRQAVFTALDALEITEGASHTEFKLDSNGNIRIIEIGARMGGDCIGSDLVQLSTGYDYVKMVIEVALGVRPSFERCDAYGASAVKFIFDEDDLRVLESIRQQHPEKIVRISDIDMSEEHTVTDSSSRYGFYILKCNSREEALTISNFGDR